jgi:hypothetical protein
MYHEIKFFHKKLHPSSGIPWETPIARIIPRTPTATSFGDSCLEGLGGYSISIGFWWRMAFLDKVIHHTLIHKKDNTVGLLVSINMLKSITVIINYCALLHIITTTNIFNDPYLVLLNITDNASALSWTNHTCRKSKIGQLLARFFCSLLINSPLGINSQWISNDDNKIADYISRVKKTSSNIIPSFGYSSLHQTSPELTHCSFLQIQPELISLIWEIVLTEKWPTHEEVLTLRQGPLDNLTTLNGKDYWHP